MARNRIGTTYKLDIANGQVSIGFKMYGRL